MWLALIKHKHMDFHDLQSTQQAMNRYIGETNALDTNDKHKKTINKKKKKKKQTKKNKKQNISLQKNNMFKSHHQYGTQCNSRKVSLVQLEFDVWMSVCLYN